MAFFDVSDIPAPLTFDREFAEFPYYFALYLGRLREENKIGLPDNRFLTRLFKLNFVRSLINRDF
jgi:hypothetical protein